MYYDRNKDHDGIWEAYVDRSPTKEMINQEGVWDYWGKWDPSGENYYYWGSKNGVDNLYRYNIETKKISVVVKDYFFDSEFSFSKNGKFMVIEKITAEHQLWMMEGVE